MWAHAARRNISTNVFVDDVTFSARSERSCTLPDVTLAGWPRFEKREIPLRNCCFLWMQLCELCLKHHKQFRVLVFVQRRPEMSGNSTRRTSQQRKNNPFFWNRQRFSQMFGSRWVWTPAFGPVLRRKTRHFGKLNAKLSMDTWQNAAACDTSTCDPEAAGMKAASVFPPRAKIICGDVLPAEHQRGRPDPTSSFIPRDAATPSTCGEALDSLFWWWEEERNL